MKLALAKGARFLRDREKENLRRAIAVGGQDDSTGLLEKSIIASRGKAPIGSKGERYLVRIKRRTYPGRNGKPVTTLQTANLMEYGSAHQPATPFIRPTVIANGQKTIDIVTTDLVQRIDKVVAKLAAQNKGR